MDNKPWYCVRSKSNKKILQQRVVNDNDILCHNRFEILNDFSASLVGDETDMEICAQVCGTDYEYF